MPLLLTLIKNNSPMNDDINYPYIQILNMTIVS